MKKFQEALCVFHQAIMIDPLYEGAVYSMACLLKEMKNDLIALIIIEEFILSKKQSSNSAIPDNIRKLKATILAFLNLEYVFIAEQYSSYKEKLLLAFQLKKKI